MASYNIDASCIHCTKCAVDVRRRDSVETALLDCYFNKTRVTVYKCVKNKYFN